MFQFLKKKFYKEAISRIWPDSRLFLEDPKQKCPLESVTFKIIINKVWKMNDMVSIIILYQDRKSILEYFKKEYFNLFKKNINKAKNNCCSLTLIKCNQNILVLVYWYIKVFLYYFLYQQQQQQQHQKFSKRKLDDSWKLQRSSENKGRAKRISGKKQNKCNKDNSSCYLICINYWICVLIYKTKWDSLKFLSFTPIDIFSWIIVWYQKLSCKMFCCISGLHLLDPSNKPFALEAP